MNKKSISKISLEMEANDDIEISTKRKRKAIPYFRMVGSGMINRQVDKHEGIDLLYEITNNTTSDERFAIARYLEFLNIYNQDLGKVQIAFKLFQKGKQERDKFLRGFKSLNRRGLMKRASIGVYMMNPMALIPKDFDKARTIWDTI